MLGGGAEAEAVTQIPDDGGNGGNGGVDGVDSVEAADGELTAGGEAERSQDAELDAGAERGPRERAGVDEQQAGAGAERGPGERAGAEGDQTGAGAERLPEERAGVGSEQAPSRAAGRRRRLRRAYQLICVATVLFFLPVSFVRLSGDQYVRSVSTVPAEPVGIVFGAAVSGDTPSPYLASRLDVSLALWRAHKIKVFLVSGDNSAPTYNEPKAMRDYLEARGVPSRLIVLDYAGFDSWETCDRAKRVFGVTRAIVVSQSFHVPRAVYLCRAAGIEAYGVGDGTAGWRLGHDEYLNDEAREILAGASAMYQGVFTPNPTFLGPHDSGVADALRTAGG